ncbi:MAG: hypothetical protein ACI9V1_002127, partial [Spirosomataceae bacterium]
GLWAVTVAMFTGTTTLRVVVFLCVVSGIDSR